MKTPTILLCVLGAAAFADDHDDGYGHALGTVEVHAACNTEAMTYLSQGLALLHHMTYEGAERAFANAAEEDPECAMAYWGQAMSYIHPLWSDPPTAAKFERGEQLANKAASLPPSTPEEGAYVEAVQSYYREGRQDTEAANLGAFEKGWQRAHERHPDDLEAASFYALSLLGTADPRDKSLERQKRAAEIVAGVRALAPEHPGAHHYIIHAFDYPPLAEEALEVARHYGEIAPDVPHALHMPTHIFTRLGSWTESIEWNERSADAARQRPVAGRVSLHYLHALDYLAYAHLQLGQDDEAEEVLRTIQAIDQPMHEELAVPYTLAAVPARLALERQQWSRAAALEPRVPASYPWDRFPAMEAITWFARAIGAARSGDARGAETALAKLPPLRDAAAKSSTYWATQIDIQARAAAAWLAHANGHDAEALKSMQEAAQLEAATEKHPVTPGEVLPAAELLGDLLMELGRYADARRAYDASLARSPKRLYGLSGAARAAELAGDEAAASRYYRDVVMLAGESGAALPAVQHARRYLGDR